MGAARLRGRGRRGLTLEAVFGERDWERARQTLRALRSCGRAEFALAGSLAAEAHLLRAGFAARPRAFNDLDVLVESFEAIPAEWAATMRLRHVHRGATDGRILLQGVDPRTRVRVDVFRASHAALLRASQAAAGFEDVALASAADLAARALRLALPVVGGEPAPRKYVEAARRLHPLARLDADVDAAWSEHRRDGAPRSYEDAFDALERALRTGHGPLVEPVYGDGTDVRACSRCSDAEPFRPGSVAEIVELLGYA